VICVVVSCGSCWAKVVLDEVKEFTANLNPGKIKKMPDRLKVN
jgi:hypothetical protein